MYTWDSSSEQQSKSPHQTFVYLFIFSNCFILVRIVANLKLILGTLDVPSTAGHQCTFIYS